MKTHFELTGKLCGKINIFLKDSQGALRYLGSTNWSKTCKEAKEKYLFKYDQFAVYVW